MKILMFLQQGIKMAEGHSTDQHCSSDIFENVSRMEIEDLHDWSRAPEFSTGKGVGRDGQMWEITGCFGLGGTLNLIQSPWSSTEDKNYKPNPHTPTLSWSAQETHTEQNNPELANGISVLHSTDPFNVTALQNPDSSPNKDLPWVCGTYGASSFALFFSYPFCVMSPRNKQRKLI